LRASPSGKGEAVSAGDRARAERAEKRAEKRAKKRPVSNQLAIVRVTIKLAEVETSRRRKGVPRAAVKAAKKVKTARPVGRPAARERRMADAPANRWKAERR
jgi:hypothetical protein